MNTKNNNKSVILWIILFILVTGFVGCVGIFQWLKKSGPELEELMSEAQEFGRQTDENGCLNHALSSLDECDGFRCSMKESVFFASCLPVSQPSKGFCDYSLNNNGFKKQAEWSVAKCKKIKRDDQMCIQLMAHVSSHCQTEQRRSVSF